MYLFIAKYLEKQIFMYLNSELRNETKRNENKEVIKITLL